MMHLQYLIFFITTSFTTHSSSFQQPKFKSSLGYNFIFEWSSYFIFNTCSMFICTCSTTSFLIKTSQNGSPTYYTRDFFSTRNSIASHTTERPPHISFDFSRTPVYWLTTHNAGGIWFSDVLLNHLASIPQTIRPRTLLSFVDTAP